MSVLTLREFKDQETRARMRFEDRLAPGSGGDYGFGFGWTPTRFTTAKTSVEYLCACGFKAYTASEIYDHRCESGKPTLSR